MPSLTPSNISFSEDTFIRASGSIMNINDDVGEAFLKAAQAAPIKVTPPPVKVTPAPITTIKPTVSSVLTNSIKPISTTVIVVKPVTTNSLKLTVLSSSSLVNKVSSTSPDTTTASKPPLISSSTPTPIPNPGPPEFYPTGIDLDLVVFCLNDIMQPSCVDFFRFVHFFFAARITSDPELAAYLIDMGLEPPESDILTRTSTSTTSVSKLNML